VQARWKTTFRALGVRNFRLFATGQLISLLGGWIQITAQDWLVLSLTHNSPTALGTVSALQFLPVLLFSLLGGKLADLLDKRVLLVVSNSTYLVLAAVMGILVLSGAVQPWHVFVFAACYGMVNALENPTRQSFVSEMVGRDLLPNALAMSAATFNSARILGPAIGGLTIALLGTGTAFVVNAVTFIAPIVAIARMVPSQLFREAKTGPVNAKDARIVDGLRYVRARKDLLVPMILMLVIGMLAFNFQITLALMAKNVFHTKADSFGLLNASLAGGALLGALAGSARKARPSAWVVLFGGVVFGALETVVGFAPTFAASALLLVPTGFFMIFFAQAANQRVQMGTSAAFRGRVMALYTLVFLGTTPIGAPLIGLVSDDLGPRSGLYLGGLVALATTLIVLTVELRRTGARFAMTRDPFRIRIMQAPEVLAIAEAEAATVAVAGPEVATSAEPAIPVAAFAPDMKDPVEDELLIDDDREVSAVAPATAG
jgi:MFS family permease